MAETKKLAGEQEPLEVRRIGFRHAVVTPARQASLIDMNAIRVQLAQAERGVKQLEAQLGKARVQRDGLADFLAKFEAQKVDRVDADPVVPLEAPVADPVPPRQPAPEPELVLADLPAPAADPPRRRGT